MTGVQTCALRSANVIVTVNPKPSAGVDQLLVCSGAVSPTTATLTAGSWTVLTQPSGATAAVDAAGAVTAMTLVGDYEFVLTNASGCKDTVKVTVPPCNCTNPDLSVTGNPAAVCAPSTIDLATIAVTDASSIVNPLTYHANATDAVSGANPLTSTVVSASGKIGRAHV